VLLVAPFFSAFRSGGYSVKSQLILAVAVFLVLAAVACTAPWPPLPRGLPLAALALLAGYAVWTGLSTIWARYVESAVHDTDRVGMYVGAFALSLAVMREPRVRRAAPEVLLAGVLVVSLYSLAGRLLPHVVHEHVTSARLSQPLTYWNSLGMFTGFGVLLGVAVAGDRTRARSWRALACAAAVPCGLAAYLTLSRGAAASVLAGLALCVLLRRSRATLVAALCALAPLIALALLLNPFPDVLSVHADTSAQASQGAIFLAFSVVATAATGLAFARLSRSSIARRPLGFRPRVRTALAIAVVPLTLAVAVGIAAHGKEKTRLPTTAARITSLETARGHYWRVALAAFGRHPLDGLGSGSFAADWRRKRGHDQPALDVHSLYLETLAELGLVGGLLLLGFAGTVAAGVVRAVRAAAGDPVVAAAAAVVGAFAVHVALDWDWEMPAVSLIALILAAAVLRPRMDP
jgi:O-antigen ligase/polysaccharide polymerase Wzy-like membrane protein